MTKKVVRRSVEAVKKRVETPLVAYIWMGGLGLTSYLVARVVLDALPHPAHWGAGIAGAIIGYGLGWLWFRWRGDIVP
jgi:hypothetical protein